MNHAGHMRSEVGCVSHVLDNILRLPIAQVKLIPAHTRTSTHTTMKEDLLERASKHARGDAKNHPQLLKGHQLASLMWTPEISMSCSEATILNQPFEFKLRAHRLNGTRLQQIAWRFAEKQAELVNFEAQASVHYGPLLVTR